MSWILSKFKDFGDRTSIIHHGRSYSYEELLLEITRISNEVLKKRIKRGEVVSVISDYSFHSIALLFALYENKNIIVPITTNIKDEIEDRVEESFTDKIIMISGSNYSIQENRSNVKHQMIKDLQSSLHSGLILFSSGSTGKPKAMIHDFDNLVDHYKGKKSKVLNMLIFLMFDHIGGLNTLLNMASMGATMILPENRNPDSICKLIQDYKIRVLPSSPTFLNLILMNKSHEKYDLSSLRMITYGTEAMPDSLLTRLKTTFPKTKFLQTFGTSETGIASTSSKSSNSTFMKIDDPNLEYKIVDDELWLKSKTQVMGYLNTSMDSFTDDGWFKTGDLVETTDDGYLKIIGRNKEVINVGGEKVLPIEVESIILAMEELNDVMVYGEQNQITGQSVVADIVPMTDIGSREAKKIIRKFCKTKLDNFKIPTKIYVVEKINTGDRFKKIRRKV
jgi:acyl-CoA synthetase (AMP-forming)/AMP-acid ligase II